MICCIFLYSPTYHICKSPKLWIICGSTHGQPWQLPFPTQHTILFLWRVCLPYWALTPACHRNWCGGGIWHRILHLSQFIPQPPLHLWWDWNTFRKAFLLCWTDQWTCCNRQSPGWMGRKFPMSWWGDHYRTQWLPIPWFGNITSHEAESLGQLSQMYLKKRHLGPSGYYFSA